MYQIDPRPSVNPMLSAVNTLNKRDKHRLLVLSRGVPNFSLEVLQRLVGGFFPLTVSGAGHIMMSAPDGQDSLTIPHQFPPGALYSAKEADPQPTFVIIFGEGQDVDIETTSSPPFAPAPKK